MTHNQIEYWKLQEEKQHNRASEGETQRHNVVTEAIGAGTLAESSKHNRVMEDETVRHNKVVEQETQRSNIARENEAHRSNVARETETNRSNLVNEGIQSANLTEYKRSNVANEDLRDRDIAVKEQLMPSQISKNYADISTGSASAMADLYKSGATTFLLPSMIGAASTMLGSGSNSTDLAPTTALAKIGTAVKTGAKEFSTNASTLVKMGLSRFTAMPLILDQLMPDPLTPSGGGHVPTGKPNVY